MVNKKQKNLVLWKKSRTFAHEMIRDEIAYRIREALGLVPTEDQKNAIATFCRFLTDRNERSVMVMRGSAGTGKTTLAAAMVQALLSLQQKLVLMAPTGRAAKVFSLYARHEAGTIHRRIYRQKTLESAFELNYNMAHDTLFMVDEASMIANGSSELFGTTGQGLLDDLASFVYNGRNCRMLLIGDRAQLPPVGEEESPALMGNVWRQFGLQVYECDLNEVLRQGQESGILYNATLIRAAGYGVQNVGYELRGSGIALPKVELANFKDIKVVPGDELIESLAGSYSKVGLDDTIVVTRSNKRANIYNRGIRNQVLDREDELCTGDRLMVVKNNYYWTSLDRASVQHSRLAAPEQEDNPQSGLSFIANGDMCVVQRVRNVHEQYGFRFAEVTLVFPDYDDYELTATVLLDTLTSEAPALTREQQEQLFLKVMEDYMDIPHKADRLKKIKEDKYFNALQIKFAYAATCHKAQGGQWAHVYVDQGYMTNEMLTTDYLHWLYTAFTRATEQLYLVNWPKVQTA